MESTLKVLRDVFKVICNNRRRFIPDDIFQLYTDEILKGVTYEFLNHFNDDDEYMLQMESKKLFQYLYIMQELYDEEEEKAYFYWEDSLFQKNNLVLLFPCFHCSFFSGHKLVYVIPFHHQCDLNAHYKHYQYAQNGLLLWKMWKSNDTSNYINWIPEEVIENILELF
jgi:hypothetical protein